MEDGGYALWEPDAAYNVHFAAEEHSTPLTVFSPYHVKPLQRSRQPMLQP